jgi:hypothetical protein
MAVSDCTQLLTEQVHEQFVGAYIQLLFGQTTSQTSTTVCFAKASISFIILSMKVNDSVVLSCKYSMSKFFGLDFACSKIAKMPLLTRFLKRKYSFTFHQYIKLSYLHIGYHDLFVDAVNVESIKLAQQCLTIIKDSLKLIVVSDCDTSTYL